MFEDNIINRSKSQVSTYKNQQKQAIERENNKLANRIQCVQSRLNKDKMQKDSDKNLGNRMIFKRPTVDNTYMKDYTEILNLFLGFEKFIGLNKILCGSG